MRAVRVVVRARRNKFNQVAAEKRQFADVLVPHRYRPAVVGIGFGAIAELVAAQGVLGRGLPYRECGHFHFQPRHAQRAQELADAK